MLCKLTRPELQERKGFQVLKAKVKIKEDRKKGSTIAFNGTDQITDEVTAFIRTERQCRGFFGFNLKTREDIIVLSTAGPGGGKGFITTEPGFRKAGLKLSMYKFFAILLDLIPCASKGIQYLFLIPRCLCWIRKIIVKSFSGRRKIRTVLVCIITYCDNEVKYDTVIFRHII